MRTMIQTIKGMSAGGRLALILSSLWVFSLAACGSGGGCIPGCGERLPTPAPSKPRPPTHVVKVTLQACRIDMPHELPPGPTRFKITNNGDLAHYLEIERLNTEIIYGLDLTPGDTKELKVLLQPGRYRFWCPFHREGAKRLELLVTVTPARAPAYPY